MTLTPEEMLAFKRFTLSITEKPRPLESQPCVREGVFLWCEDWEIIEISKYFFNGRDMYFTDPPPNRLKHNPLWSKEDIAAKAEALWEAQGSAAKVLEVLHARRSNGHPH